MFSLTDPERAATKLVQPRLGLINTHCYESYTTDGTL